MTTIRLNREQRRALDRENDRWPSTLKLIPPQDWPNGPFDDPDRQRVWRSREFVVQEFRADPPALVRLSVSRTAVTGTRWADNITWDELQDLKAQCGYAMATAVEVYPPASDVVNVANMRHLWVLRDRLAFAWRNGRIKTPSKGSSETEACDA